MLPPQHRLRSTRDFRATTRARKAAQGLLVVHFRAVPGDGGPARVGLTVGKPVGNAVARHAVSRRLRHLAAAQLPRLPEGSNLVIRALPGAAQASSERLAADLSAALDRLLGG